MNRKEEKKTVVISVLAASDCTGQWRLFSHFGGRRLRPPSGTLWTDPDYPSGPNPRRPRLPDHYPTPKKDSLQWIGIPRHCAPKLWNFPHNGDWREKESTNPPTSPHTPHRHTWESKGPQPHPRNPAQYPGISCSPLLKSPSSLPPGLIQTELIWPEPLLKSHHTSETIKYTKL